MIDIPPPATSYLLDTDTLSNLLRERASPRLVSRLALLSPEAQYTTSITIGELLFGAYKNQGKSEYLIVRIEGLIAGDMKVLPFDEVAAREYARLRADLERQGLGIGDADTRIAAIALAHNLTLITGNVRHFERVPGLRVENWMA